MAWQPRTVVASQFGKNCRPQSANRADRGVANQARGPADRHACRLPLFPQFPPATLFAAIRRSAARSCQKRCVASGTGLAMGWLAARAA
jgi:hypothetical protein